MNSANLHLVQRRLARILVACGTLGCATSILLTNFLPLEQASSELLSWPHAYGALINLFSLVTLTTGCYLAGYVKAFGGQGKITLDFTNRKPR